MIMLSVILLYAMIWTATDGAAASAFVLPPSSPSFPLAAPLQVYAEQRRNSQRYLEEYYDDDNDLPQRQRQASYEESSRLRRPNTDSDKASTPLPWSEKRPTSIGDSFVPELLTTERNENDPAPRPILQRREQGNAPGSRRDRRPNINDYDYGYRYDVEDEYDGGEFVNDYDQESGNFWANPVPGLDNSAAASAKTGTGQRRQQQQRSKTSFRSVEPQPPAPIVDLYNRLFWYGLGENESADASSSSSSSLARNDNVPDKTMFGGTKGKFNGLAFLNAGMDRVPDEKRPRYRNGRRPSSLREENEDAYNDKNMMEAERPYDDNDDEIYKDGYNYGRRLRYRRDDRDASLSQDRPQSSMRENDLNEPQRPQRRRQSDRRNDRGDWVSNTVSTWFSNDNDNYNANNELSYQNGKEYDRGGSSGRSGDTSRRNSRREQRRNGDDNGDTTPWFAPFSFFDTFLGLDRDQLQGQAATYDMKMGLKPRTNNDYVQGNRRSTTRGSTKSTDRLDRVIRRTGDLVDRPPQSRGYGYSESFQSPPPPPQPDDSPSRSSYSERWNVETANEAYSDNANGVIDAEPVVVNDDSSQPHDAAASLNSVSRVSSSSSLSSWQERALAVERVPPANVDAWGPTGDLGMDARTKAVTDAVQDVQTAQLIVDEWDRRIGLDKDDIAILRIDVELERRRQENGRDLSRAQHAAWTEQIRRMDRQVDDMARRLRYNMLQRNAAVNELNEIKARHWALLSFYDPNQAEEGVAEMLRELEETEPAVRRYKEKNTQGESQ